MKSPFEGASAATLRTLSQALRAGRLLPPISKLAIRRVAPAFDNEAADELVRLASEGMVPSHAALLLEAYADLAESRLSTDAELVWTGPETAVARSRDTAIVLAELFASASRSILVSTFVVHEPERVFGALAHRMAEVPSLQVKVFANVARGQRDTRHESEILREFATNLRKTWPGAVRPFLYYDPRALSTAPDRANWHAKVVIIDEQAAFVTSANFTAWAQERNVEAGVVIRNEAFARQLCQQFESLIVSKNVLEVPGFR